MNKPMESRPAVVTDVRQLAQQVQHNCHLSDALHARNYSLCIYLLKMREYFRWEMGYGFEDRLPEKQLGEWLTGRERMWDALEDLEYRDLITDHATFSPFGSLEISHGPAHGKLIYSGGYGGLAKPHFFLADLVTAETHNGHRILITGREHARDLTAPPAMSQAGVVFVRRESLRRTLWEKIEEWRWHRQENAMSRTLAFYPVETALESALDDMTDAETETLVLHELGELTAGQRLGEVWEQMLNALWHTRAELVSRAVRDHLADCLVTLPRLLEDRRLPSLHFYMANLEGMRQVIFPALATAYQRLVDDGDMQPLYACVQQGQAHWEDVARRLLAAYGGEDDGAATRLDAVADDGIEL